MGKLLIILLLSSICVNSQIDDKTKHFYAGFGITCLTAEITNQITDKPFVSCLVGFGAGTLAGIAKEAIWDKAMDKGTCSNLDAGMTIWGSAVGALCIRVRFDIRDKKRYKPVYKDYYN